MNRVDDYKRSDGSLYLTAYYYSFFATKCEPVDRVLSAVAIAGKNHHHTNGWADDVNSGSQLIQEEAVAMAKRVVDLEEAVRALLVQVAHNANDVPGSCDWDWEAFDRYSELVGSDAIDTIAEKHE